MEDTGLQNGVEIDAMFSTSTLRQYVNMGYNNESHSPLMNVNISPSNISSVSTLTSLSDSSIKDELSSLQNPI